MHDRQFEELVRAHRKAVTAYARAMTGCDHLAEEATQATFFRAWRYLDSFRGAGSFEGWLIRICRRCIFDLHAAKSTPAQAPIYDIPLDTTGSEGAVDLRLLLQRLSPAHREVIVVCGLLGYDYETASAILDLPIGTIRSRLSRARGKFRDLLTSDVEHTA